MNGMKLGFAILLASAGMAGAEVMTFDDVSGNYTDFDQSLGDIANLDVSNVTRVGFGNTAISAPNLDHWELNYSELEDVAFPAVNGDVGELAFTPATGFEVLISGFDFGNYPNGGAVRDVTFRIYDLDWNVIWELVVDNHTGASDHVTPNVVLSDGGYFQWGTDWDIGIDNFEYSVRADTPIGAVPLPAGLPLLAGGLALMALLKRRR